MLLPPLLAMATKLLLVLVWLLIGCGVAKARELPVTLCDRASLQSMLRAEALIMTLMTPLMPLSKMATANVMVLVFLLVQILMLLTSSTLHSPLASMSSSPLGSSLSIVTL